MTFRILTVCTANVCRSPIAQVFLAHCLQGKDVQVHSAGTLAISGNPADQTMQSLLTQKGYAVIAQHRSQALMPSLIAKYDLLLCMENEHAQWIVTRSPVATAKVKLLGHWEKAQQVSDPIGQDREVYAASVEQIEHLSRLWANKLMSLGVCA
ncbi:low molecular weight phosphotyrosine protein phosphatase [Polynucleobacter sphagniphilus]|uniref:arsenate reductase/protein-tyrosine-phosphatase family protein n=1 Tax=Polynucleobacter sphagniphilus TaxID=1743169 RepID=UPI00247553FA|nr:low molecular weight phosphotyrosine protein phosphatase [Polynucleobacter sphagniphilus]MDH6525561.1 protein-tyrosine phosphatase [Polynucleobacter sphagniphilus]